MYKLISLTVILTFIFGCASTESTTSQSTNSSNKEITIIGTTLPFDPLEKITNHTPAQYINSEFVAHRPYFEKKYPNAYISEPLVLQVENEFALLSPWMAEPIFDYGVFPTAHFTTIGFHRSGKIVSHQYRQADFIAAMKQKYDIEEVSTPIFHYVLKINAEQQPTFENDVFELLKSVKPVRSMTFK